MFQKMTAFLAVAAVLASIDPLLAGSTDIIIIGGDDAFPTLPAPGILGLVAMGVIGAIALARSRK